MGSMTGMSRICNCVFRFKSLKTTCVTFSFSVKVIEQMFLSTTRRFLILPDIFIIPKSYYTSLLLDTLSSPHEHMNKELRSLICAE